MRGVLRKLIDRVEVPRLSVGLSPPVENRPAAHDDNGDVITQEWVWPRVGQYLREKDVVVTETGTASFGICETRFPTGVVALNQSLWGSIGWAVGACQGAALAARDDGDDESIDSNSRRTILFVGDGSLQLTAQEVSTIVRLGLRVTMFVICNEGYTIERFIHGADEAYNDIAPWKYKDLPAAFGAGEGEAETFVVRTKAEMDALLSDDGFQERGGLQLVEVHMPKMDAPGSMKLLAAAAAKNNAKAQ